MSPKHVYAVYVAAADGWDQECPDRHGVFFGGEDNYVHPARGGIEPAGHLVIIGYRAALAKRDEFNSSGDWHGEEGPLYAIRKLL